jgi:hypothetical protein
MADHQPGVSSGSSASSASSASTASPASTTDSARGLFGRLAQRLTRSSTEDEAQELRAESERQGATPICDLPNRERADVCGTVRSVTMRPRADVPALVVEIYDGSRPLHLVWLGRREILGIHAGVQLRATGRVSYYRGVPTIFNPFYEIVPKGA